MIWHFRGGEIQTLEEELSSRNPAHDDVIDALAAAIDIAIKPTRNLANTKKTNIAWQDQKFRGLKVA
jgi:hypothetical protein